MGFKYKNRKLIYKSTPRVMKGYIAEPCTETKNKGKTYVNNMKKKKLM